MKLVLIPAGKFLMGAPAGEGGAHERPQHEVRITKAFHLGACTVTQAEYEKVMGSNPSLFSHDGRGKSGVDYCDGWAPGGGKDRVKGENTQLFPVENVSVGEMRWVGCVPITLKRLIIDDSLWSGYG